MTPKPKFAFQDYFCGAGGGDGGGYARDEGWTGTLREQASDRVDGGGEGGEGDGVDDEWRGAGFGNVVAGTDIDLELVDREVRGVGVGGMEVGDFSRGGVEEGGEGGWGMGGRGRGAQYAGEVSGGRGGVAGGDENLDGGGNQGGGDADGRGSRMRGAEASGQQGRSQSIRERGGAHDKRLDRGKNEGGDSSGKVREIQQVLGKREER